MILGVGIYVISFGLLFFSYTMYHLFSFINIGVFALAIMGIINAANGKTQAIPILGDFFDKMFSGIN